MTTRIRRSIASTALLISLVACSGGDAGPGAGTFDVPETNGAEGRATARPTVPVGKLRPPSPARMFAGTQSVAGQLTRYCKGSCMEAEADRPDYLHAPTGAFVLFTLGDAPIEAVAEVRVDASERPGLVRLSPGSLMVFNHGLGQGRYLVDLLVRWRTSEARWRFGLQVT